MNRAQPAFAPEQIASVLGQIHCPGSLNEFSAAMAKPWRNVIRHRREIDPVNLPVPSSPIAWYGLGRRPAEDAGSPARSVAYACGDFFIQDAGSLLALAVAGADGDGLRGKVVCDLCAAPGGKASALLEAVSSNDVDSRGFVLANEVIGNRIAPLQLNLARAGSDRFAISSLDPEKLADQLPHAFDLLLVDAPCSGQAMMSRGKQNQSALSTHQISHSASRQQRILEAAVKLVRDGGQLIYSTCTFAEAENEAQIRLLIEQGVATPRPIAGLQEHETDAGCYRCWPHVHQCAGSFAASLTIQHSHHTEARKPKKRKKVIRTPIALTDWYTGTQSESRLHTKNSVILGFSPSAPEWVEQLAIGGPEVAHRAGQTWKPAHAGALRRNASLMPINKIEIHQKACQQFMRGEPIESDAAGWNAIQFHGRPLGWVKANGKIGKNHLPPGARMSGELTT
ncbi:MAG: SAM-dependent methyltransferase [Rubripirellula sp.]|nr:SAM-dependent methyltransferase [Rubripirellula sp.]